MYEQLDQPAWDRMLDHLASGWNARVELLHAAEDELKETAKRGRRLPIIEQDMIHWSALRDEARRERVALERKITLGIEEAVEEAGKQAVFGRAKRMEAAREWAIELAEEKNKGQLKIITSRMTGAQRELDNRQEELREIGPDPLYRDERTLGWLEAIHEIVLAAIRRDERARDLILGPWRQREAADAALLQRLMASPTVNVAAAATYAQGAIHLIGGNQLAVVEIRDGNDQLRVVGQGMDRQLLQQHPDGERPAGATTGSMAGIIEATTRTQVATGVAAQGIICFHGWSAKPARVDDVILCGPKELAQIIAALPPQAITPEALQAAADSVGQMPNTLLQVPAPGALDQFSTVSPEDIPTALPNLRAVVTEAQPAVITIPDTTSVRG